MPTHTEHLTKQDCKDSQRKDQCQGLPVLPVPALPGSGRLGIPSRLHHAHSCTAPLQGSHVSPHCRSVVCQGGAAW